MLVRTGGEKWSGLLIVYEFIGLVRGGLLVGLGRSVVLVLLRLVGEGITGSLDTNMLLANGSFLCCLLGWSWKN